MSAIHEVGSIAGTIRVLSVRPHAIAIELKLSEPVPSVDQPLFYGMDVKHAIQLVDLLNKAIKETEEV